LHLQAQPEQHDDSRQAGDDEQEDSHQVPLYLRLIK
jgi:hypothetical protein